MSELKSTKFLAGWFTHTRIRSILQANELTRGAGADERIRIADLLAKEWNDAIAEQNFFKAVDIEISIQNSTLKAWAIGLTAGWMASDADDHKCRILLEAAKALKVWGMVQKALPKVDDAEFEADEEVVAELAIDGEGEE